MLGSHGQIYFHFKDWKIWATDWVIGILNGQTEQIVILSHLYIYQMEIWNPWVMDNATWNKESRPVKSYLNWANRINLVFRQFVLKQNGSPNITVDNDQYCIACFEALS